MGLSVEDLAKESGKAIFERFKVVGGDAIKELSAEALGGIERASFRVGYCKLLAAAGRDVTADLADVEAQMANWQWTGASIAKRNFWLAVMHVLAVGSQAVGVVLGSLASAALARLGVPTVAPLPTPPPEA